MKYRDHSFDHPPEAEDQQQQVEPQPISRDQEYHQSLAKDHTRGVKSTAAISGHPIHPALVPFPIAFLVGALLSDLAYWWTADSFWARGSLWLVGAGVVTGGFAATFGLTDFLTIHRAREHVDGWVHFIGNVFVLVLGLINWALRLELSDQAVLPWGLVISTLTTGILTITAWYGGELTFRHMIGVTGHNGTAEHKHHS
jgi:uncharacterized membrane protein